MRVHLNKKAVNKEFSDYTEGLKKQETEEERIMRLQTEAYEKFRDRQIKKNQAHEKEQSFIEKLQSDTGYPGLAAALGLVTDAQKLDNDELQRKLDLEKKAREEQEAIVDIRSVDDVLPRPTADAQLELLQRITTPDGNEAPEEINSEFKLS